MIGNSDTNIFCKFQLHSCQIFFFQNGDLKYSEVATTPYPPFLTAYPTLPEGGIPICFRQNDRKGCSLDYLDGFGHFLFGFGFGAAGKNSRGLW